MAPPQKISIPFPSVDPEEVVVTGFSLLYRAIPSKLFLSRHTNVRTLNVDTIFRFMVFQHFNGHYRTVYWLRGIIIKNRL